MTSQRISEALALRCSDVDLGERRVHVRRRVHKGSYSLPKSRYGRRNVPLRPALAQRLWDASWSVRWREDGGVGSRGSDGPAVDCGR